MRLIFLTLILVGCQPANVSAEDAFTDETAEPILENNITWRELCQ